MAGGGRGEGGERQAWRSREGELVTVLGSSPHPRPPQAAERYLYFPNWAMALLITLIAVATLPIPVVFILRHFHLLSDGSNTLSVSYKKGRMMKDISNLEENDETRFILSKVPSEAPSPMPTHRSYLGPGSTSPLETSGNPNGRYGGSYLLAGTPESEL